MKELGPDQRMQQLLQNFGVTNPNLVCLYKNKVTHLCINPYCQISSFSCSIEECLSCIKHQQHSCATIKINSFAKIFRDRIQNKKTILQHIIEIQEKLFQQIRKNRSMLQKSNIFGFDFEQKQVQILEQLFNKQVNNINIQGCQIAKFYQRINRVKNQSKQKEEELINKFQEEARKTMAKLHDQQESLIEKLFGKGVEFNRQLAQKFPTPLQHSKNPFNSRFKVQIFDNSAKITCLNTQGAWVNWVKSGKIPQNRITTFTIKHTNTNAILSGIATSAIFGVKNCHEHKQALTFYSHDGGLWQNGGKRFVGRVVEDGESINVVVNTVDWQVSWYVGAELLANRYIAPYIRQHPIFFVILMHNKNDIVQLLYE